MKKIKFLTATAILFVFFSCKKNETVFLAHFYSTDSTRALGLYIDDQFKGNLPHVNCKAFEATNDQKAAMLFITLPSGRYKLSAKDASGTIVSEFKEYKIKGRSGKLSEKMRGGTGSQESSVNNNELVFNFY